eukprot:g186.t1
MAQSVISGAGATLPARAKGSVQNEVSADDGSTAYTTAAVAVGGLALAIPAYLYWRRSAAVDEAVDGAEKKSWTTFFTDPSPSVQFYRNCALFVGVALYVRTNPGQFAVIPPKE